MLLDKIAMMVQLECHLDAQKLSMVGVSGGPDSVCLLHVLHTLGHNLVAVHVNHRLRREADQEAQMVERFVTGLGVEFVSCQVDVVSYAEENSLSIEEAARTMRYECLFKQAEQRSAQAVLVAHNADDQVETILMHLLRGSGLTGLRGMESRNLPNPWSEHIPLVRPLTSTWRSEILEYLAEHQLSFISDLSNYDTIFFRNRLRHELLPSLEKYNPRIRENLLRMGQINKEDYAVLQQLVTDAWQANFIKRGPGFIAFRLAGFRKLQPAIQRYLLRKAIAYHLPSLRDIDFDSIQRGLRFLCDDHRLGQSDLIAGLRLIKEGEVFWLAAWQADLPGAEFPAIQSGAELPIKIPSTLLLEGDWQLQVFEEPETEQAIQCSYHNDDPFQAWLDLHELALPLVVRTRKPGDRFQPLGMQGHSLKVSDLMVNLKMPKRVRSSWPLVCSGENIIWIPGCRQGHMGRIQPGSCKIVHLILSKGSSA